MTLGLHDSEYSELCGINVKMSTLVGLSHMTLGCMGLNTA